MSPSGTYRTRMLAGDPLTPAELRARLTEIVDGLRFASKAELYRIAVSAELTAETSHARVPVPHASRHIMVHYNHSDPARPLVSAPAELMEFLEGRLLDYPTARAAPAHETEPTPKAAALDGGEWDGF